MILFLVFRVADYNLRALVYAKTPIKVDRNGRNLLLHALRRLVIMVRAVLIYRKE